MDLLKIKLILEEKKKRKESKIHMRRKTPRCFLGSRFQPRANCHNHVEKVRKKKKNPTHIWQTPEITASTADKN